MRATTSVRLAPTAKDADEHGSWKRCPTIPHTTLLNSACKQGMLQTRQLVRCWSGQNKFGKTQSLVMPPPPGTRRGEVVPVDSTRAPHALPASVQRQGENGAGSVSKVQAQEVSHTAGRQHEFRNLPKKVGAPAEHVRRGHSSKACGDSPITRPRQQPCGASTAIVVSGH
jgi:hypothetical protein